MFEIDLTKFINEEQKDEYIKYLDSLSELKSNWDGCGAKAISPISIKNAKKYLEYQYKYTLKMEISPTADGNVKFEWKPEDKKKESTIYRRFKFKDNNTIDYFIEFRFTNPDIIKSKEGNIEFKLNKIGLYPCPSDIETDMINQTYCQMENVPLEEVKIS